MNHTPQIKKAIQFAARKHHGQMRISNSDGPLPYVTHLFSVALLVAEDGADDDVVTAALLHDTLEDTETTREEIVAAFNERVAVLVESVSEIKVKDGKKLDWKEFKTNYLTLMEQVDDDALRIAIADKVDNVESRIEEFEKEGKSFFEKWGQPNENYLWFYGEALRIAETRLPDHPLTKRFAEAQAKQLQVFAGRTDRNDLLQ